MKQNIFFSSKLICGNVGLIEEMKKMSLPELTKTQLRAMYGEMVPDKRRNPDRAARGVYNVVNLWERHHEILNLHLLGLKNVEIANKLNITEVSVSQIINSDLGRSKLAILREERDEQSFDVMVELQKLAEPAIQLYKEILEGDNEDVSMALKKRTADTVLEMQGFGKTVKIEGQVTQTLQTSLEVMDALSRGLAMARRQGLIIEAEVIDVGES